MSAPLRIRRPATKGAASKEALKPYLDRLLKLIPAEVISLYLFGITFVPKEKPGVLVVWAVFCLACAGFVKAYGTSDTVRNVRPDWMHVGLSMIAFVIWVYSLGGPFVPWGLHEPYIGSLLIAGFSFLVPFFYRGQPDV